MSGIRLLVAILLTLVVIAIAGCVAFGLGSEEPGRGEDVLTETVR